MIQIIVQRNDFIKENDRIYYTVDSIIINGIKYNFKQGKNIKFQDTHKNILKPTRDNQGKLSAIVIKQYIGSDKANTETESHQIIENIDVPILIRTPQEEIKEITIQMEKLEIEEGQRYLQEVGRERLTKNTNSKNSNNLYKVLYDRKNKLLGK
ncbi:MAG: hypothetical protein ACRC0A_07755 [Chitinophagaceae bacterium]